MSYKEKTSKNLPTTSFPQHSQHGALPNESVQFLKSVIDGLSDNIAVLNDQGDILLTNKSYRVFAAKYGLDSSDLSRITNYLLVCDAASGENSEEAKLFAKGVRDVIAGNSQLFELEYCCHAPDRKRWFIGRASPFTFQGRLQVIVAHTDITERKQAEAALRKSQELLNITERLSNIGGWEWNVDTQTMHWTEETYRIHGFTPGEIEPGSAEHINKSVACYEPDTRPIIMDAFERCVVHGEPYDLELPFTNIKGSQLWVRTIAHPVVESGKVVRVIGNLADITERKQAEEERESLRKTAEALAEVFLDLGREPQQNMDRIVRAAGEVTECAAALYNRLDDTGCSIEVWSGHQLPPDMPRADTPQGHICYEATIHGQDRTVVIGNLEGTDYERTDPAVGKYGLKAYLGHPIHLRGVAIGALAVVDIRPRSFTPGEIGAIKMLAKALSLEEERYFAEQELRQSEERFRGILQNVDTVAVQGYTLDGTVRYWNRAAESFYGYTAEEALGRNLLDLIIPPAMRDEVSAAMQHMTQTGEAIPSSELALIRKDGSLIPVYSSHVMVQVLGKDVELYCIDVDLTELKRTEAAINAARSQLHATLNALPDLLFEVDSEGRIFSYHSPRSDLLAAPPEVFLGKRFADVLPPDASEACQRAIDGAAQYGCSYGETYRLTLPQGVRWFELSVAPLHTDSTSDPHFIIISRNITERKQAEVALKENKELLSQTQSIAQIGSWKLDVTINRLTWSDEVYRIFGCEPQEFDETYESFFGFVHPDDRAAVDDAYSRSLQAGEKTYEIEHRIVQRHSGKVRYVHERCIHEYDDSGTIVNSIGMVQDITERKRIELDLIAQKNAYQSILSASHDGFLVVDSRGQILDVNTAYMTFSGYDRDELLSLHISELDANENIEEATRHISKVTAQGSDLFESEHRRKNGTIWAVEVSTTYSPLNDGRFFTFLRDITERKQAQWALEQKNQELEHLVYSVSHDLKSPLITVRTYAGMLQQDLLSTDQQQINEDLNYIDKAANKMQQLLDALLKYSRIGTVDAPAQTASTDQQVQNCLATLAGILRQHQVQVSTGDLPQQLHGDPLHLGQIWQNLIENAVKYRGDQPHPHIEIGATQDGPDVVFYVRDNGMGIAPEHRERIFNLFSQLNPGSDGSGLGLALVKKIVTIYQGRIWVESDGKGKGSCFMFTLPGALVKEDTVI